MHFHLFIYKNFLRRADSLPLLDIYIFLILQTGRREKCDSTLHESVWNNLHWLCFIDFNGTVWCENKTGDTGEITQEALIYAIPSCVCFNPLNDHGTKKFSLCFSSSAGGRKEGGGVHARLHLSKLYEPRKTELMLRDGNRSRKIQKQQRFPSHTATYSEEWNTQMKQSNRAKWSGWRTVIA